MTISDNVSMFYNAKPHIFEKAKILRLHMTYPEKLIWERLKNKQILGLKFRPQHPIDIFIADFYCHKIKLVIEIDGEIHKTKEHKQYDIGRTAELEEKGITVIRYTNNEVLTNTDKVILDIKNKCDKLLNKNNL